MSKLLFRDRCINHRGAETQKFIADYFSNEHRFVLLIAGAGFDPRSITVCQEVAKIAGSRLQAVFIREERPNAHRELLKRALENLQQMTQLVPKYQEVEVDIFASDGAVIGGRNAVQKINQVELDSITDIIVDFSALSTGVAFPIVRYLFSKAQENGVTFNLHLMVTDEPLTDNLIRSTACDTVETIHGFMGSLNIYSTRKAAKLWLPQLVKERNMVLDKIYRFVNPHDVCPILPFPATHPRMADELIEQYINEFESIWMVDTRNIVYADERNPLDLYRTILRINDARKRVFAEVGDSLIILSPIGSKVLAIGALMAAIEKDFPIVYMESIGYTVDFQNLDACRMSSGELVHIWLYNKVYVIES